MYKAVILYDATDYIYSLCTNPVVLGVSQLIYGGSFSHFCGNDQEEEGTNLRDRIPKHTNVDYMMAPPEGSSEQQSKGVMVYCIDVSTSMGSTFRIPSLQGKSDTVTYIKLIN